MGRREVKPVGKIKDFKHWFMQYGNDLLVGYLRAVEDDNPSSFKEFVLSEYENYREHEYREECWEVAYMGDAPGRLEQVLTKQAV